MTREDGDHELIEITMTPKKVEDDKPIVMAAAILQNSKLHFLKFVYEVLYKFLRPGTFRLNYADTDSLCISEYLKIFYRFELNFYLGFSKTAEIKGSTRLEVLSATFLPLVKPELMQEFLATWDKWFVLEDTVRNEKTPGLMKSK